MRGLGPVVAADGFEVAMGDRLPDWAEDAPASGMRSLNTKVPGFAGSLCGVSVLRAPLSSEVGGESALALCLTPVRVIMKFDSTL